MMNIPVNFGLNEAVKLLPKRKTTDNKSAGGRSLIVAGSEAMFGAAVLAATAAARCGSGYTYLMTDAKKFNFQKNPDFLIVDYNKKKLADLKFSALAMGPGLAQSKKALSLLKELIKLKPPAVVLDADALNLWSVHGKGFLPSTWIVTPHEAELARILKVTAEKIKNKRLQMLVKAQKKLGCIVVLKGHRTLVATGKQNFKVKSGNAALAKAGTGDVLCGMITGLLAQGLQPDQAALLAVFIHGFIADIWVKKKKDALGLLASDLLNEIPHALYKLRL